MATSSYNSIPSPPSRTENKEKMPSSYSIISDKSQENILAFSRDILQKKIQFTEFVDKMDAIDIAYARYKVSEVQADAQGGVDVAAGSQSCDIFSKDDVVPPIVVSQVDSYVAYLSEVFLSGTPLFPVVSSPSKRLYAEQLEAIIDDHAQIGAYARHLLMAIRDAVKYNFGACEVEWDSMDQFSVLLDIQEAKGQRIDRKPKKFNRVIRLNPRNTVWDYTIAPADVPEHGDYAGYIERISRMRLKKLLTKYGKENKSLGNDEKALCSSAPRSTPTSLHFSEDPQISKYINSRFPGAHGSGDWSNNGWFDGQKKKNGPSGVGTQYEKFTLYARILPSDFGIKAPSPNTSQIWKFVIINGMHVISAERIISAYDYIPILFMQPLEDGLKYQTQSVAEGEVAFQEAANTLFNIRFSAARRAVADRGLYDARMIKPSDVNSKAPAAKIPVSIPAMSQMKISDAYMQIPFDMRGTETTIQDASLLVEFSKQLHGMNNPRQGMFQKGNKSVKEWDDTMSGSEGRMRLPALCLEFQFFNPLKNLLQLNILQHGEDGVVVSQKTGQDMEFKIQELRKANLSFELSDGYSPKSKVANTEVLLAGMQLVMNSPILQQAYGNRIASMFAHFMSLSGLKGFEEYDPNYQVQNNGQGIPFNNLQQPGFPTAGIPQPPSPGAMNSQVPGIPPQMPPTLPQ